MEGAFLGEKIMHEVWGEDSLARLNGAPSCERQRKEAATKLAGIIQRYHSAGEQIAPPDERLMALLQRVAESGDQHQNVLTKTWVAASHIINAHIEQVNASDEERSRAYQMLKVWVEFWCLPAAPQSLGSLV